MLTEYGLFDVPKTMTRAAVAAGMLAVAPTWRAMPELIHKIFVCGPSGHAGAYYPWQYKAAAL